MKNLGLFICTPLSVGFSGLTLVLVKTVVGANFSKNFSKLSTGEVYKRAHRVSVVSTLRKVNRRLQFHISRKYSGTQLAHN